MASRLSVAVLLTAIPSFLLQLRFAGVCRELGDPSVFKPQLTVYAIRRPTWDHMDAAVRSFDRMPPMQKSA